MTSGNEAELIALTKAMQQATSLMPDALAGAMFKKAGVDRLAALHASMDIVRRGGTVSLIGVYAGEADPMPMMTMFDKQIQLPLEQGPDAYDRFQKKEDGVVKVLLRP
jgi:threonine dehydrogenase-like Zn-dependent dehydrogenase